MRSTRIAIGSLAVIVLVLLAAAQLLRGGEPKYLSLDAGLTKLVLQEVPPGADITWEAESPSALKFFAFENGTVFVFNLTKPTIVTSDVIDWESKRRDKTKWVITVRDGPSPDPGPGPEPPPPVPPGPDNPPADLDNSLGVGLTAWREAKRIGLPDQAAVLAKAFMDGATAMIQGRLPADVKTQVEATLNGLDPRWKSAWLAEASKAVSAATDKYGTGIKARASIYREVARALEKSR